MSIFEPVLPEFDNIDGVKSVEKININLLPKLDDFDKDSIMYYCELCKKYISQSSKSRHNKTIIHNKILQCRKKPVIEVKKTQVISLE